MQEDYVKRGIWWDELGHKVESLDKWDEVIPWEVEERSLAVAMEDGYEPITTHRALVRSDNKNLLSVVSKRYGVIRNQQTKELLAVLVDNGAEIDSIGTASGGRQAGPDSCT